MGICSSGFQANRSFFVSEWTKEKFAREKEQIAPITLLSWATWGNCSQSLFCKRQKERFAQSWTFLKSDESNLQRATGAIHSSVMFVSHLFYKKREKQWITVKNIRKNMNFERIAHRRSIIWAILSERSKERKREFLSLKIYSIKKRKWVTWLWVAYFSPSCLHKERLGQRLFMVIAIFFRWQNQLICIT